MVQGNFQPRRSRRLRIETEHSSVRDCTVQPLKTVACGDADRTRFEVKSGRHSATISIIRAFLVFRFGSCSPIRGRLAVVRIHASVPPYRFLLLLDLIAAVTRQRASYPALATRRD
jgi:hypothetical protein